MATIKFDSVSTMVTLVAFSFMFAASVDGQTECHWRGEGPLCYGECSDPDYTFLNGVAKTSQEAYEKTRCDPEHFRHFDCAVGSAKCCCRKPASHYSRAKDDLDNATKVKHRSMFRCIQVQLAATLTKLCDKQIDSTNEHVVAFAYDGQYHHIQEACGDDQTAAQLYERKEAISIHQTILMNRLRKCGMREGDVQRVGRAISQLED